MTSKDQVPTYTEFMLPTLHVLADGKEIHGRDAAKTASDALGVSAEARAVTISSGTPRYMSNAKWAQTYLVQAGLVHRPRRGVLAITESGKSLLLDAPTALDAKYLERYPSFIEFQSRKRRPTNLEMLTSESSEISTVASETPVELISDAVDSNLAEVESDLITRVRQLDPVVFERLVLRLLVSLGYGTDENAEQTKVSGDEGIDGIIYRDVLGLDRVYMQAKRYTENSVGREAIQAFYGALAQKRAERGVFITTSHFTKGAKEAAQDFRNIILIDGNKLVRLMAEHGVGVEIASTHVLKRIDEDFFDEL